MNNFTSQFIRFCIAFVVTSGVMVIDLAFNHLQNELKAKDQEIRQLMADIKQVEQMGCE